MVRVCEPRRGTDPMSYEDDLRADPLALAKTYSLFPGNMAGDFDPKEDVSARALKGDFNGFNHSNVKREKKIARVTLSLAKSLIESNRGPQCLMVKPSLKG